MFFIRSRGLGLANSETRAMFNFVRQGKYFRLTSDLMKAVTGSRVRYRILQAAMLYLRRQNVSRAYVDLARNLEDIGQRIHTQPGGCN